MQIGYIGLGKMGLAQVARLLEKGWRVVAWNRSAPPRAAARRLGADVSESPADVCKKLKQPRLIWIMVAHAVVDEVLRELVPYLAAGDTVIDGGNSFYKESQRRARELTRRGIHFLDVGVSGGPSGARNGACLMIGGHKRIFRKHERLFKDLSAIRPPIQHTDKLEFVGMSKREGRSYAYVGKSGAGHFVKMVHNGIEYGMMQAIGEGFAVLKKSQFKLNLKRVSELYNSKSVIESRLIGWLTRALKQHGENLKEISGEVAQSGEGLWTVQTAKELGVPVKVIEESLKFRIKSKGNPSYTGQVVSALRNQFGGHEVMQNEFFQRRLRKVKKLKS